MSFLSNVTTALGFPPSQNISLSDLDLQTIRSAATTLMVSPNWPLIDLAWIALSYGSYLTLDTPRAAKNYQRRFKKSSSLPLYVHLTTGAVEVFRYHIKALSGPVVPDVWDLAMSYVVNYGSLDLAKDMLKGHPVITRAVFQSEALIRVGLTTAAYALGNPFLHRASIKTTNNFLYTRIAVSFAMKSKLFSFSEGYAVGAAISPFLAMAETGIPAGLVWFLTLLWFVIKVNRWTSEQIIKSDGKAYRDSWLVWGLTEAGFVELVGLKKVKKGSPALSAEVDMTMGSETKNK